MRAIRTQTLMTVAVYRLRDSATNMFLSILSRISARVRFCRILASCMALTSWKSLCTCGDCGVEHAIWASFWPLVRASTASFFLSRANRRASLALTKFSLDIYQRYDEINFINVRDVLFDASFSKLASHFAASLKS